MFAPNYHSAMKHVGPARKKMGKKTMIVPKEIDRQIAVDALKAMDVKIDKLTKEQKKYAESW